MVVAFDVSGTLRGGGFRVEELFKWFQSKGCEMVIWSNEFTWALDEAKQMGLSTDNARRKITKYDADNELSRFMDIAVDDDPRSTHLAAKHFIFVNKIVHPSKFEETYGPLLTGGSNG